MSDYKLIKSVKHLKKECKNNPCDFFIHFGVAKSSKRIEYNSEYKTFDVYNDIDETWQEDLTDKELETETNIVEAINNNRLFKYEM